MWRGFRRTPLLSTLCWCDACLLTAQRMCGCCVGAGRPLMPSTLFSLDSCVCVCVCVPPLVVSFGSAARPRRCRLSQLVIVSFAWPGPLWAPGRRQSTTRGRPRRCVGIPLRPVAVLCLSCVWLWLFLTFRQQATIGRQLLHRLRRWCRASIAPHTSSLLAAFPGVAVRALVHKAALCSVLRILPRDNNNRP